ncbi:hypothetical protein KP509_35G056700 [Ceratopteris richardii]|uniref:Homeobox domain-containing protein n=1 Tax=Ceratopteris richardii TaxID=49495 RepID=A0A8T2QFX9_CERRI|nr:hypothetical protein KP509_35G056700 [Ceratopteris richardii]
MRGGSASVTHVAVADSLSAVAHLKASGVPSKSSIFAIRGMSGLSVRLASYNGLGAGTRLFVTADGKLNITHSTGFRNVTSLRVAAVNENKITSFSRSRKVKKVEDDPWEALFQQLEEDLQKDTNDFDEEEITEEDLENLEKELDMLVEDLTNTSSDNNATGSAGLSNAQNKDDPEYGSSLSLADHQKGIKSSKSDGVRGHVLVSESSEDNNIQSDFELHEDDDEGFTDDDYEELRTVALQKWQLRKLAAAVELGRRKVNIKSLAAELKLDRDDVIYFLKNPPPELLMALGEIEGDNDPAETDSDQGQVDPYSEKSFDSGVDTSGKDSELNDTKEEKQKAFGPRDWYNGKRIKKANMMTLQRVFKRTNWPTNSMIESLVQATHLPRARILEWFEEERSKSGVRSYPRQSSSSRKVWKRPVTHSFDRLQ